MYPTQEFVELGEFVRDLDPAVEVVSFGDPDVAIYDPRTLIGQIAFSRAVLTLTNADDPDCTIIAGYIDFVLVNPDDPDLDDAISLALQELHYPTAAQYWAEFFESRGVPATVRRKLGRHKIDGLAIVLNVFVDPCVRGHKLAPWLLAHLLPPPAPGAQFAILSHLDAAALQPPKVVATNPDGIGHLVDYWQRETHLRLVGEDLLGAVNTPGNAAATLDKAHQREDTYIKIVPAGLRARSAADDDTLFPLRDGRVDEQPAAGPPEYLLACAAEAAVVAGTADEYEDDDVDAQVVTVLSFTTFTGEGGSAELFARAAEYLETHPELLVIGTNWHSRLCNEAGEHLTLDITVRLT